MALCVIRRFSAAFFASIGGIMFPLGRKTIFFYTLNVNEFAIVSSCFLLFVICDEYGKNDSEAIVCDKKTTGFS